MRKRGTFEVLLVVQKFCVKTLRVWKIENITLRRGGQNMQLFKLPELWPGYWEISSLEAFARLSNTIFLFIRLVVARIGVRKGGNLWLQIFYTAVPHGGDPSSRQGGSGVRMFLPSAIHYILLQHWVQGSMKALFWLFIAYISCSKMVPLRLWENDQLYMWFMIFHGVRNNLNILSIYGIHAGESDPTIIPVPQ